MAGDYAIARFATLFREEASLSETVQWLQQINYRAATGQPGYRDLEAKVLALLNDGLLPDGHRAERVDPDGLWVTHPSGASVRIQLFGLDSPYSSRADALRRRLTELETAVFRGDADETQLQELTALAERITPSPASRTHDALLEP